MDLFSQINTNQQIVEARTDLMLDSISTNLPDSLNLISIKINSNNQEIKSFLLNQFAQYFAKKKITVSLDSAAFRIVIENFSAIVEYQENKAGILGLNRELRRNIFFKANGFIIDNSMIIIDTFKFDSIHDDDVRSSDLNMIENSPYLFCHGITVSATNWTKYIEPGIIIASVASVVFLLFTMRF